MSKSWHKAEDKFESKSRAATRKRKHSDPETRKRERGNHWLKTGVSPATVAWMEERDML